MLQILLLAVKPVNKPSPHLSYNNPDVSAVDTSIVAKVTSFKTINVPLLGYSKEIYMRHRHTAS